MSGRSDAGARRSLCIGHRTGEASLIRGAVHGVMMLCPSFHTVKCQTRYNSFVTFLPQVAGAGRLADGGAAAEVQQLQRAAAAHDSGAASHSPRQPRPRGDHPPRLFWLRLEKPLPEPFTGCPRGSWVPQCCALAPAASSLLCVWALARHRSGNNRSAAEDPRRMPRESVVPQCAQLIREHIEIHQSSVPTSTGNRSHICYLRRPRCRQTLATPYAPARCQPPAAPAAACLGRRRRSEAASSRQR